MRKKQTSVLWLSLTWSLILLASISVTAQEALLLHYPFNEGQGFDVLDVSGNENHGMMINMEESAWVEGKEFRFGLCLELDGIDDHVKSIVPFSQPLDGDFTLSMWFTAAPGFRARLFTFSRGGERMINVRTVNDIIQIDDYGGVGAEVAGSIKVTDQQWHHVALVRSSSSLTLYLDGEQHLQAPLSVVELLDNVTIAARAHSDGSLDDFLTGKLDEFSIYAEALDIDQIRYVMEHPFFPAENAFNPGPSDQADFVARDTNLTWSPSESADTHDVYFGTVFDNVNDASRTNPLDVLASQGQNVNTYDPAGLLDFGQTYFWRIDEVSPAPDNTISKGFVWSFTIEPIGYPLAGENITATASSLNNLNEGPENTINGSGLDANDLHSDIGADMWLSSTIGPQPTWIQYEFDKVYALHEMLVWNHNTSLELALGFGIKEAAIEYSTDGTNWTTLGTTHEFARANGVAGYVSDTTVDFGGVAAKYVKINANSNWGGILPQFGLSEVRFLFIPLRARKPNPDSGAIDMDVANVTLSWRAGREAASHDVYLGTDEQAVIDETVTPVSVPAGGSYASSDAEDLDLAQTYYWKVNEVNQAETPTTWQGDVWNFATREYLVVDDFEDYNDSEGFEIFSTWMDGFDNPANGALASYDFPPFAEQTIVHNGRQSMPLRYDNSTASFSEATASIADLAIGQDWTKHGIKALSLYFYGDATNAVGEQLYVKLNGSKVEYGGNANAPKQGRWKRWGIDLASFGVNLGNVTEITVGLERTGAVGGKGVVFFDHISLHSVAPEPVEEIFLEAEAADILGANWRVTDDPTASGGKQIGSLNGDGNDNSTAPGAEWVAVSNFTVAGGVYKVVLRAQENGSDSFWVRITTATSQTHENTDQPGTGWVKVNGIDAPDGWVWEEVFSDDHDDAVVFFTLPAGANTLEIAKREDGVLLDAILIINVVEP